MSRSDDEQPHAEQEADWESLVAAARTHRDATLAQLQPPLPELPAEDQWPKNLTAIPRTALAPAEVAITETPAVRLVAALAAGELTATAVTNAFLRRAGLAQRLTNCVLELVPDEALARARELDAFWQEHRRPVGPLHGLPVSIKALISWRGHRATAGLVANWATVSEQDAAVLRITRELGAIPFVRTTEPQGVMMLETISPIHGSTRNPHQSDLSPGGSSGGEGALQALLGSPLGLGTDIGGSVRSPAANCGLYTLKPSCSRLPMTGVGVFFSGCEGILGTLGPISPSREGLSLFMKSFLDTRPWETDPSLLPIPWRTLDNPFKGTINVGVMWDDGIVKPSRAMSRALREVVAKLETNPRFRVSRWEPFKHDEGIKLLDKLYSFDGGDAFTKALARSGEPIHELTDYRLVSGPGVEKLSVTELWGVAMARNIFRYNYLQEWLQKAPDMHVILCPPHPGAAPLAGTTKYWGYTSIWNLLDYPAAVFPVTRVDPELDHEDAGYTARNEHDAWAHKYFDAKQQAGAPVCLQLVGKRLEDELVIEAMNEICEAARLPLVDCVHA